MGLLDGLMGNASEVEVSKKMRTTVRGHTYDQVIPSIWSVTRIKLFLSNSFGTRGNDTLGTEGTLVTIGDADVCNTLYQS
jgi:hypothetical protein